MNENKRLAPICIVYIDGVRMSPACEGALRSARVIDPLNNIGQCTLTFGFAEMGAQGREAFPIGSEVSVHLGYKDDARETFLGYVSGQSVSMREGRRPLYKATVSSMLGRMNHVRNVRQFANSTPSRAVKTLLERYGLKADVEDFGPEIPHWNGSGQTDWDAALRLAKLYGRDICCRGKSVHVRELMTMHRDEHVYERGKSLISFEALESVRGQPPGMRVHTWNHLQAKAYHAEVKADEVRQKIGGSRSWLRLAPEAKWTREISRERGPMAKDAFEAKELADARMREIGMEFNRAEGRVEGDPRLAAGALVTMKGVGAALNGDYIADAVIHRFGIGEGYETEFYLKRNMMPDDFKKPRCTWTCARGPAASPARAAAWRSKRTGTAEAPVSCPWTTKTRAARSSAA